MPLVLVQLLLLVLWGGGGSGSTHVAPDAETPGPESSRLSGEALDAGNEGTSRQVQLQEGTGLHKLIPLISFLPSKTRYPIPTLGYTYIL